ncbi:phage protein [Streptococcus pneumoniae]|nr:phage protein [Streptococcus pneumoniae]
MNKQELIKKLEERRTITGNFQGYVVWRKDVKEIFEQLGEPQPVKVPQFVADFIAEQKKLGHTLSYSIDASMSNIVAEWYWDNSELFALAWLNGYEVEKEKRYFVKIKGNIKENMLVYGEFLKRYFFTKGFSLDDVIYSHTRKQLEDANFGWVFDCEGIDIEEVENE